VCHPAPGVFTRRLSLEPKSVTLDITEGTTASLGASRLGRSLDDRVEVHVDKEVWRTNGHARVAGG
jgi:hypothetical protein